MRVLRLKRKCLVYIRRYANVQFISAEAALLRKVDVDVEGGWKVGESCVQLLTCTLDLTPKIFSVPYASLTKTFALIEATTKRIEKTSILTSFLLLVIQRSGKGDFKSLLQAVYLCINRVRALVRLARALLLMVISS